MNIEKLNGFQSEEDYLSDLVNRINNFYNREHSKTDIIDEKITLTVYNNLFQLLCHEVIDDRVEFASLGERVRVAFVSICKPGRSFYEMWDYYFHTNTADSYIEEEVSENNVEETEEVTEE